MPTRGSKSKESKSTAKRSSTTSGAKRASGGDSGGGTHTSSATAQTTTDHETIRRWAEERGGQPACVRGTGGKGDIGMLRIDFPGYSGEESLQHINWDDWFEKFDERELALLYQEETAGGAKSNFNKIVSRETAEHSRKPKAASGGKTRTAGGRS